MLNKLSQFFYVFYRVGSRGGPEGPGRVPRQARDAPAAPQGALGGGDQVHWWPFGGVLDLQKYARASILMVKQG